LGQKATWRKVNAATAAGISLPDRELACAPIKSDVGQLYLGAMRAAINCALANRGAKNTLILTLFLNMSISHPARGRERLKPEGLIIYQWFSRLKSAKISQA
jgi:RNA-splicing ligase RtcB